MFEKFSPLPEHQFLAAINAAGIDYAGPIIADGNLHRFKANGDKGPAGWYVLHGDGIAAGTFGHWKLGINGDWYAKGNAELTEAERAERDRRFASIRAERKIERRRGYDDASHEASVILGAAQDATNDHPYLQRKRVSAHLGVKCGDWPQRHRVNCLLVPLHNAAGDLITLEAIYPEKVDGEQDKDFLKGGRKTGAFFMIGRPVTSDILLLAEGYATAATVHEATGHVAVMAVDAGNLKVVAETLHVMWPAKTVIICADNDRRTDGNPGLTKATAAAEAINGLLAVPQFADGEAGSDFNDLALLHGLDAVRGGIEAARKPTSQVSKNAPTTDHWPRLEADDKPPHIATDLANGYRVARDIGRDLLYVINIGWYAWNGTHWCRGEEFAYRKAQRLSRLILADAAAVTQKSADTEDGDHRQKLIGIAKALTGWAQVSESRDKVYAAMTLAKPMLAIEHSELDRDNWLLNCVNGVLDLRTGEMRQHRRDDFMTRCIPVAYDPQAKCPTWLAFLNRIFADIKDIIHFVQKVIGYSLTGDNSEQCVFFMHGSGQNGKSTLITVVQALMGAYAHQAAPDLLLASKHDRHPTELAELRGARLVTSVETGDSRRLNESLVKQMSGGDRMKGRFMRQDFFEFDPTHKVCLATNHKPIIRGTDYAIWRRIRLIPFTVAIPPEERDRKLPDKLKAELQGLLAWAVRGCLDWQREGLNPPQEVVKATDQYREEMDVLKAFFDECCVIDKNKTVAKGALYGAYKEWRDHSGERAETQRSFSNRMQEQGFEERKTTGGLRVWQGIGLTQVAQVAQSGVDSGINATSLSARGDYMENDATNATNATLPDCRSCQSFAPKARSCGNNGAFIEDPARPLCGGKFFKTWDGRPC